MGEISRPKPGGGAKEPEVVERDRASLRRWLTVCVAIVFFVAMELGAYDVVAVPLAIVIVLIIVLGVPLAIVRWGLR